MKIQPLTRFLDYPAVVREKTQDQAPHQEHSHQEQSSEKDQAPADFEAAIEKFESDVKAQESGLNVSIEGQGPGLKVILKDTSGGVIRSFTGEEFLKLRQATSKDGRLRGKILDQKL